jgi:signal transducing adaptor molecule
MKRLAHRNPNVQLYALSLTDSLSKNCGVAVNKEIASRAFTQGLEKLVTDRVSTAFVLKFASANVIFLQTAHDKVRKRALSLIAEWTTEFEEDSSLGIMEDCFNNLKSKGAVPR